MFSIIADLHCHTVVTAHAYSTVLELAQFAEKKGLKALAVTDHGPKMIDGAMRSHFENLGAVPRKIGGVWMLRGAEVNILNYEGRVDLDQNLLRKLDWVIASFHESCCQPGKPAQHTEAYLKIAENPYIDVLGHSGTGAYPYDHERVLAAVKAHGKAIEINSHSFKARPGAAENCREIALACKRLGVPIVVTSDAHICFDVGNVKTAAEMLESIDFPEKLILNADLGRLAAWVGRRRGRTVIGA